MEAAVIMERAYGHLEYDRVRYPEPEMVSNGLNPAQNLIELLRPQLQKSYVVEVPKGSGFIDLRQVDPGVVRVVRVRHGEMVNESVDPGYSEFAPLELTTIENFGTRPRWFRQEGEPRRYYLHGRYLLGIWPRPNEDSTFTLTLAVIPTPLTTDALDRHPDLREIDHELIGDVAYSFLLIKEGGVEVGKSLQRLETLLGQEALGAALKSVRRRNRDKPADAPVTQEREG